MSEGITPDPKWTAPKSEFGAAPALPSILTPANAKRLLWAGFFCIFAAGVGFGVRGRILMDWAREYGFTQKELGDISGGGLWGFGVRPEDDRAALRRPIRIQDFGVWEYPLYLG